MVEQFLPVGDIFSREVVLWIHKDKSLGDSNVWRTFLIPFGIDRSDDGKRLAQELGTTDPIRRISIRRIVPELVGEWSQSRS